MAKYDWSKYISRVENGEELWTGSKQYIQKGMKAYSEANKNKTIMSQDEINTGLPPFGKRPYTSLLNYDLFNPAKALGEANNDPTYNTLVKKQRKEYIDNAYSKVSNYDPKIKIVDYGTKMGKLDGTEKFSNQLLGVFGNIKNLKKPKVVYQTKAEPLKDPVSQEDHENIWENILQLIVVAEDKNRYYFRNKDGSIDSVKKEFVSDTLPDLDEQKLKYKEARVANSKLTATMFDKMQYNISQGVMKVASGSPTKAQVPTGNKALDIATNIGGEALGFLTPVGEAHAVTGLSNIGTGISQVGERLTSKLASPVESNIERAALKIGQTRSLAQKIANKAQDIGAGAQDLSAQVLGKVVPNALKKQLTTGVGKEISTGAIGMGAYSGLESTEGETTGDTAKRVLENMFMGGVFAGTIYGSVKGAKTLISKWKGIPETPATQTLTEAASKEYQTKYEAAIRADTKAEQDDILNEAVKTLDDQIEQIKNKYGKNQLTEEQAIKNLDEQLYGKTENVPSKIEPSNELLTTKKQLADLQTKRATATDWMEQAKLDKQIELLNKKVKDLDLQVFGGAESTRVNGINPNIEKTKTHIVSGKDKTSFSGKFDTFYRNIVDRNRRLYSLTKAAGNKEAIATENPYKMANIASSYEGIAKSTIEQAITNKEGKVVGESLKKILKGVPRKKSVEFEDYLVLRHAKTLAEYGKTVYPKEWGLTAEDMTKKIAQYEVENPTFKNLATRYNFFGKNLVKTQLIDSGLLSGEEFAIMEKMYPQHVTLRRKMSEVEIGGGVPSSYTGQGKQLKKMKGTSERPVIDPIRSMIENVFNYTKAAKRNEVAQSVYKLALKNPDELAPFVKIVQKFDEKDLNKLIAEGDLAGFTDKINAGFEVGKVKDLSKANIVTLRIKGKTAHMEVSDPVLLDNLTNLNTDQLNSFVNMVGGITNSMKTLTTGINPMFGLARNIWRDLVTGYVQSTTLWKFPVADYVQYMAGLTKSAMDMLIKGKGYKEFRSLGGGFFSSAVGSDKKLLPETVAKYVGNQTVKGKLKTVGKAPLNFLEWLNNTLETMPRYAEYRRTVNKLSKTNADPYAVKMEGLYNANEITVNFKRSGKVTKSADAFVPYLNAAVQGLDKTLRTLDPRNPKQLMGVIQRAITSITVPSLLLYAVNSKNKDYQQLSDFVKDNNFLIPIDAVSDILPEGMVNKDKTLFIKIPKPREFGVLFGSLPERLARQYQDEDPEAWDKFMETVIQNFSPPNIVLDNIAAPMVRNLKSEGGTTWRGTPVVGQALLNQSPGKQYDENTSAVAKFLGDKLNFAPKKVDELMKSYLGGVAQIGIPAMSSRTLNEKGIINASIEVLKKQVTANSLYNTDKENDFYTYMKNVTNKKADLTREGKLKGKGETYIDKGTFVFSKAAESLSDLRKEMDNAKSNSEKDKFRKKMLKVMDRTIEDYKTNYLKKKKMKTVERQREFKRSE